MPSARTYQAVGFATWHGGRWYLRRHLPELRRATATAGALAGTAAVAAIALRARNRHSRLPTV